MPQRPPRHRPPRPTRPSAAARGYDSTWRRESKAYLLVHPICSCGEAAAVVDHIVPHRGNIDLLRDPANWQSLCKRCHDRKTVRQDGGFGR